MSDGYAPNKKDSVDPTVSFQRAQYDTIERIEEWHGEHDVEIVRVAPVTEPTSRLLGVHVEKRDGIGNEGVLERGQPVESEGRNDAQVLPDVKD